MFALGKRMVFFSSIVAVVKMFDTSAPETIMARRAPPRAQQQIPRAYAVECLRDRPRAPRSETQSKPKPE